MLTIEQKLAIKEAFENWTEGFAPEEQIDAYDFIYQGEELRSYATVGTPDKDEAYQWLLKQIGGWDDEILDAIIARDAEAHAPEDIDTIRATERFVDDSRDLTEELAAWERASDEDFAKMEDREILAVRDALAHCDANELHRIGTRLADIVTERLDGGTTNDLFGNLPEFLCDALSEFATNG